MVRTMRTAFKGCLRRESLVNKLQLTPDYSWHDYITRRDSPSIRIGLSTLRRNRIIARRFAPHQNLRFT
jgi:hypothetical protein